MQNIRQHTTHQPPAYCPNDPHVLSPYFSSSHALLLSSVATLFLLIPPHPLISHCCTFPSILREYLPRFLFVFLFPFILPCFTFLHSRLFHSLPPPTLLALFLTCQ